MTLFVSVIYSVKDKVDGIVDHYFLSPALTKDNVSEFHANKANKECSTGSPQNKIIKLAIPQDTFRKFLEDKTNSGYCSKAIIEEFEELNIKYQKLLLKLSSSLSKTSKSSTDEFKQEDPAIKLA